MGSDDEWFEDYDTDVSMGSDDGGSPYPSDSEGGNGGGSSSSGGEEAVEAVPSEAASDRRNRLYTVIDRSSLRHMQVRRGRDGRCCQRAGNASRGVGAGCWVLVHTRRGCSHTAAASVRKIAGAAQQALPTALHCDAAMCALMPPRCHHRGRPLPPPSATPPVQQEEALGQVQAILGCSTTTARALLIYFSWDAEAVLGA